jgi:hypothetical protein
MTLGVEGCAKFPFVSGHFGIEFAKPLMTDRYCFTFLRDPIERLISLYTFCSTRSSDDTPLYYAARRNSLDGFLRLGFSDDEHLRSALWNHQVWQLAYGRGAEQAGKKQVMIADIEPDDLLQTAIGNLSLFDHVGLVETFDTDIAAIFSNLGKPNETIRNANVSKDKAKYADLPQMVRQTLLDLTDLDRILYGYACGLRSTAGPAPIHHGIAR